MRLFLLAFYILSSSIAADIKSTSGQIKFDTDQDDQPEIVLNQDGLGIGITPSSKLHVSGNSIINNQLFVGGESGSSSLNINGTIEYSHQVVTNSTTLSGNSVVIADTSSTNIVLSLPEASSHSGRTYTIKKSNPQNSLFVRDGGLIDQYTDLTLGADQTGSLSVISSSGNWYILSISGNGDLIAAGNLVLWWKFDETSGSNASDSSNNGNDSTAADAGLIFSGQKGKFMKSIEFDGNSSFSTPDISSKFNDEATLSVWVKLDSNSPVSSRTGSIRINSNSPNINHYPWTDGNLYINTFRNSRISVGDNSAFDKTQWHHLAITTKPGANEYIIYQNGNSIHTNTGLSRVYIDDFDVGKSRGSFFLDGQLDDLRIYNKQLSSSEILALYSQGQ